MCSSSIMSSSAARKLPKFIFVYHEGKESSEKSIPRRKVIYSDGVQVLCSLETKPEVLREDFILCDPLPPKPVLPRPSHSEAFSLTEDKHTKKNKIKNSGYLPSLMHFDHGKSEEEEVPIINNSKKQRTHSPQRLRAAMTLCSSFGLKD
mmetsp:Transcript_19670/g.27661  ORF Transcript_19670/g.27661 Transcript_19670/m.27661 type:complete len:149 (-) Transcript_19670:208-654(-)